MPADVQVVNTRSVEKVSLKRLICESFGPDNRQFFYSIEVSPKPGLRLDFSGFETLPLFVDITWIKDTNLEGFIHEAPAIQLANKIKSVQVVNSITCYKLDDRHLNEILSDSAPTASFTVLRGDLVDDNQKFKFACELIAEIRSRTLGKSMTIFAAGYTEGHVESENSSDDLRNLKTKVDSGVDFILTQVLFSSNKFIEFVENCQKVGISVPIIPGLNIPRDLKELDFILQLTRVSMDAEIYENFKRLQNDDNGFKSAGLLFAKKLIAEIKQSPHFVPGFHFFTMNDFEMVRRLVECEDFASV